MKKLPRTVSVRSYVTKKGIFKRKHKRTRPDGIAENNYSYKRK